MLSSAYVRGKYKQMQLKTPANTNIFKVSNKNIIKGISPNLTVNQQNHSTSILFFKACVRYFSLFLKYKCFSLLVRTKYIEKKFNLKLFFLPTVSRTFILSYLGYHSLPTCLKLLVWKK